MDSTPPIPDSRAAARALRRFMENGPEVVALAGSLAMAVRCAEAGVPIPRQAGDVDVVAESIASLPAGIADEYLCMHIHPRAAPGRVLAQFVHPGDAVRIDVFRAHSGALARADVFRPSAFAEHGLAVLSAADQAARAAVLCLKLAEGATVAPKHLADLAILAEIARPEELTAAWEEARGPHHPAEFGAAAALATDLSRELPGLLVPQQFSTDLDARCPRCESTQDFVPASPAEVFGVLGYV